MEAVIAIPNFSYSEIHPGCIKIKNPDLRPFWQCINLFLPFNSNIHGIRQKIGKCVIPCCTHQAYNTIRYKSFCAEEVVFIGRLFNKGIVDLTRTIAVAGSEIKEPQYKQVLVGAKIGDIVAGNVNADKKVRLIDGNPLTGMQTNEDAFLLAHTTEVTAIPEGDDANELFGWIAPRFKNFSVSRSYFSWLLPKSKEYVLDARVKGGHRHMIFSGEYDSVFPMDIYPEQLVKAIIAGDIDRMEALGIYEVAPEDFAVAEFVDSSKVELQRIVREGLDMLRKENE
jgi:Na+-transporting NADH:ubiquinone oxidoreductase subunit A